MLLTIKLISQETFKVEIDPTATILELKQKVKEVRGYEVENQKLIFSGKIMSDELTIESYGVQETGFIVIMHSPPKPKPTPQPAKTTSSSEPTPAASTTPEQTSQAPDTRKDSTSNSKPATGGAEQSGSTPQPSAPPPSVQTTTTTTTETAATPAAVVSTVEGGGGGGTDASSIAVFNESTFLTGTQLEETVNNIKAMGFSEELIRRALVVSFNNPDRAVELLVTNHPSLHQTSSSPTSQEQERPREPTPGIALTGESADLAPELVQSDELPAGEESESGLTAEAAANTLEYLSQTPQFQQIRTLIQSNPAFLEPLLGQLQSANPELFEQINQNREEFFRLMTAPVAGAGSESSAEHAGAPVQGSGTGGAGLDPLAAALAGGVASEGRGVTGGGANTPGYITINLTHEERAHIETIMSVSGVSREQAIEIFLLCDKNAQMALNYIMDNPNDI